MMSNSTSKSVIFAQEPLATAHNATLEKLVAEYGNWTANIPLKERVEAGNSCVIKKGAVNFLLDPYDKKTKHQICDIEAGSHLLFPFLYGWADNGSENNENLSPSELTAQAYNANKGQITMQAKLDNVPIVDVKVITNGQNNTKTYFKLPPSNYYQEVLTPNLIQFSRVNVTSGLACTKLGDNSKCEGIALCFCGFISNMTPGDNGTRNLDYHTTINALAEESGKILFDDHVFYKFNVK
ncbi:MAG TPA: hypothetical protein VJS91_07955 [Nitrososphaeraceae archaeon]|nr:hypothetical protein [Nitrososphaeraceae archaeon]